MFTQTFLYYFVLFFFNFILSYLLICFHLYILATLQSNAFFSATLGPDSEFIINDLVHQWKYWYIYKWGVIVIFLSQIFTWLWIIGNWRVFFKYFISLSQIAFSRNVMQFCTNKMHTRTMALRNTYKTS